VYDEYKAQSGNGVKEYLYQLANLIKDDVQVNFLNFILKDEDGYQSYTLENGIHIHHFGRSSYKELFFPKRFQHWLRTLPENSIFHLHSVFRLGNYTLARKLKEADIPYVFTPHDSYSAESLKSNYLLKRLFLLTFEKYILDHAKLIHAITADGVNYIAKYTRNRIKLVTNFVADHLQQVTQHPLKDSICFIGRYDIFQKGIDHQLWAYRQFKSSVTRTIPFMLIGNDKGGKKRELLAICRELNLQEEKEIFFLVNVSDDEKYKQLIQSYVYLQLSRFEGFGLSIVEALALQKPVIITAQVPISHIIREYQAGFVVNTPEEAANALSTIYSLSPAKYREMAENARKCYLENFYPDLIKPKLINLYQSSLDYSLLDHSIT
jgi:glycosyltransferase involved in cell wall biosynthesis